MTAAQCCTVITLCHTGLVGVGDGISVALNKSVICHFTNLKVVGGL